MDKSKKFHSGMQEYKIIVKTWLVCKVDKPLLGKASTTQTCKAEKRCLCRSCLSSWYNNDRETCACETASASVQMKMGQICAAA